jgi:regulator of vacuolar morphogenesis
MPYTLSIPSTTVHQDPTSKPYTVYNLTITTPLRTSTLPKRYTDFVSLHTALHSSTGTEPPASLPAKSWFSRTVNNPELTESRRQGLEAYVKAIEATADSRWRSKPVWRDFLGFSSASPSLRERKSEEGDVPQARPAMSAAAWLDLHGQLKQHLQDARTQLARREQAPSALQQHEAGASAKRSLVKANTLLIRLDDGLKALQDGSSSGSGAGDRLGEGEIRRRRDLLSRARKEREGLDGVLNAWSVRVNKSPSPTRSAGTSPPGRDNGIGIKSAMPGAFPGKGRVLGGPAKETERTRELDNEEVLKLQKEIINNQDMSAEQLGAAVRRLREMGVAIHEELVEQDELLKVLDHDMDRYALASSLLFRITLTDDLTELAAKWTLRRSASGSSSRPIPMRSLMFIVFSSMIPKICSLDTKHRLFQRPTSIFIMTYYLPDSSSLV